MLKTAAVAHFGTALALARALGIASASVSEWGEVVPKGRAYELQVMTGGVLRVDTSLYPPRKNSAAATA
jgi:DNA-binding transcriptional regulator YdaS (Cro superfamily)